MTFDEWLEEERIFEILEVNNAVEVSRDAWNAAMLQAMEAVDKQQPKIHDSLIDKKKALLSIAEIEA